MGIKSNYEQAKRDYKYLVDHHNADPSDITGAFGEGEHYMLLLDNPCKKLACEHFIKLIEHTAASGFEHGCGQGNTSFNPDLGDIETVEIYRRYGFEGNILISCGVDISE